MHEVFLCRVAAHPVLKKDLNFHVFLEYNQDVSPLLLSGTPDCLTPRAAGLSQTSPSPVWRGGG